MQIQDTVRICNAGKVLGREALSIEALRIAKEIVDADSYRQAIIGAGQLQVLAIACGRDAYWQEQVHKGQALEQDRVLEMAHALQLTKDKVGAKQNG